MFSPFNSYSLIERYLSRHSFRFTATYTELPVLSTTRIPVPNISPSPQVPPGDEVERTSRPSAVVGQPVGVDQVVDFYGLVVLEPLHMTKNSVVEKMLDEIIMKMARGPSQRVASLEHDAR